MSAERFNLSEFSEYLDDTDGHRLAQFLQKKSGAVRTGGRRIFDCEPERFSLNVQLKRLSSPPLPPTKDVENQTSCNEKSDEGKLIQLEIKSANITSNQRTQSPPTTQPILEHRSEIHPKAPNVQNIPEHNPIQPIETAAKPICHEPESPHRLQNIGDENRLCISPLAHSILQSSPSHPLRPISPASPKSKTLRSGGLGSADRLRRQVLKRLSNLGNNGRRTLLKEFESTIASSDFSPNICSTPMQQMPRENSKTPPNLEDLPTSSRANENLGNIPNVELIQAAENNCVNKEDQPLIRNMVETLEETIKKLKSFENPQGKISAIAESSQSADVVPNTQDLLLQARVETSTKTEISRNMPATQDLLQEVQNALQDLRKSQLQAPKIVIPVNQTFNNAPPPTTKETSCNESITGKNNSKITQQTETDRILTAAMEQVGSPATIKSAAENVKNCGSSHNFINHATFTRMNSPNETPPLELTRDQTLKSGLSLSKKTQLTFSKHNSVHADKSANITVSEKIPSPKCITRKSVSINAHETRTTRSSIKGVSKPNISCANPLTVSLEMDEEQANSSARSRFEATSNKTQKTNISKHSLAHVSKRSILNEENVRAERTEATRNESRAAAADNFNNSLITEDEDEYEAINIRPVLRKSGPLNLATDKQQQPKRSRRTIRRTTRNRRPTISIISSDTEADTGPPPAHPLNLHNVQRVDSKRVQQLKRTLNKPPSTPKNGELFADELKMHLARLTNHEILDLRKRNSMGLLAPTRLRKSSIGKKISVEDQLRIEDEIQLEILRRELLGSAEGLHDEEEGSKNRVKEEVMEDEMIFNELPVAPDEFKDNATVITMDPNMRRTLNDLTSGVFYNSSLIDDNSNEHVSFRSQMKNNNTTQVRKSRARRKPEQMPEVTRKYMELHKSIKKRRKSKGTKRSLYSKGNSSESESESADKFLDTSTTTIEPIPPPPIVSPLKDLNIPSPPPPPLIASPTLCDETLPPPLPPISPPTPFMDDCPNYNENTSTRNLSTSTRKNSTLTQAACQPRDDDDDVFKKPTMPAPRAASKRKSHTKANKPVAATIADNANETHSLDDTNSLRRSKRGQVPRKLSFLCGTQNKTSLFESLLNGVKNKKVFALRTKKQSSFKYSKNNNMPVPVASSTVTGAEQNSKATTPAHSYLGDTNTTSGTLCSVRNSYFSRLGVIEETETESDGYAGDVEHAGNLPQMSSDNEVPSSSTKSAQPKRKVGRPKKSAQLTTVRVQKEKKKKVIAENEVEIQSHAADEPVGEQYSELTSNRIGQLECSRTNLPPPPSREKLNAIFDELKNAANDSSDETTSVATSNTDGASSSATATNNSRTRKVRVRLQRVKVTETAGSSTTTPTTSVCSSTSTTTHTLSGSRNERNELLTWLKNATHLQCDNSRDQVFKDMRSSAAGKLYFTDLEGIDYAFYDTKEKCSLGYLRFKPLQCKPTKRAKKYHLHFVVLAGTFEIGTDNEKGTFSVGDMVAINIGCRYKITNLDNDVGIIMVFKK